MNLTDKIFHDYEAARLRLEAQRWPDGAYCPHCGECEQVTLLAGKSLDRPGLQAESLATPTIDDVADVVDGLLQPAFASVTGQTIAVDGGRWSAP